MRSVSGSVLLERLHTAAEFRRLGHKVDMVLHDDIRIEPKVLIFSAK